jgi:hypothetical protein
MKTDITVQIMRDGESIRLDITELTSVELHALLDKNRLLMPGITFQLVRWIQEHVKEPPAHHDEAVV